MNHPHLTLGYTTSRRDCRIEWFFESLRRQTVDISRLPHKIVVVDFYHAERDELFRDGLRDSGYNLVHVPPKPTVWQGPSRLTSVDYYAYANVLNTVLCLAPDGWIALVDDLSFLAPQWISCVYEAMTGNYIAAGSYKKVKNLKIENGTPVYDHYSFGVDTRWNGGSDKAAVPCTGQWLYGYAALPVEGLLQINGWDEDTDCCGLGGGDYIAGLMLEHAGYKLRYDRRMLAIEDNDLHFQSSLMRRPGERQPGRDDAGNTILQMVYDGRWTAPNYFPGGIRAERDRVLRGEPFSSATCPCHSWYSGIPLSEL